MVFCILSSCRKIVPQTSGLYRFIFFWAVVSGGMVTSGTLGECTAGNRDHAVFGGGMAVQAGYVRLENRFGPFSGVMRGLGGKLHFYLGRYLRLGGGGASVSLPYEQPGLGGSYVAIGYGGVTAEATIPLKQWRISAGVLGGGALYTNMHLINRDASGEYQSLFIRSGSLLLSPILTVERSLTGAITLMGMVDYLWGPHLGDRRHLGGAKVHVGVLFNK